MSTIPVEDFNKNHPERMGDEVFIGYFSNLNAFDGTGRSEYECVDWKTKRKGGMVYDINGKAVGSWMNGRFPVFVKQSEINAKDPEITKRLLPST